MDLGILKNNSDVVQAVIGALVAAGAIWGKSRKFLFKGIEFLWRCTPIAVVGAMDKNQQQTLEAIKSLRSTQKEQGNQITNIESELQANGLGSVKDVVTLWGTEWRQAFHDSLRIKFVCDIAGRNVYVSRGFIDMVGLESEDDLLGESWQSFVDPEDKERYDREWHEAFEQRRRLITNFRWRNVKGLPIGYKILRAEPVGNYYMGEIIDSPVDVTGMASCDTCKL